MLSSGHGKRGSQGAQAPRVSGRSLVESIRPVLKEEQGRSRHEGENIDKQATNSTAIEAIQTLLAVLCDLPAGGR